MITIRGERVTFVQLQAVKLTRPKRAGAYWQGTPHHELVRAIIAEVLLRKWKLADEPQYSLSRDGADLAAAFELRIPKLALPAGVQLALGVMTSNARRRRMRMFAGANVTVCNNGLATGEIILSQKHTTGNADSLDERLGTALDCYLDKSAGLCSLVDNLRDSLLTEAQVNRILMKAGRAGMMPWSRIGLVDSEYAAPRYKEFNDPTAWALLNAFTCIAKMNPPLDQMDQINNFRALLENDILMN